MSEDCEVNSNPGLVVIGWIGSLTACFLSVILNHSFWWAVLHFIFGWFYVLYVLLCRAHEIVPGFKDTFN